MSDAGTSINDVELSTRAYFALRDHGIHTLGELAAANGRDVVSRWKNCGKATRKELRQVLVDAGLRFADEVVAVGKVAALERELAETRAVLSDVLEARGESWLAQLVGRREEVLRSLKEDCVCADALFHGDNFHGTHCPLGSLLCIVGGPEETQRQVDAAHEAHEAALRETEWLAPWRSDE